MSEQLNMIAFDQKRVWSELKIVDNIMNPLDIVKMRWRYSLFIKY